MERQLETYQKIERSIIKKFRKQLWTPFIVAVKRYELIQGVKYTFNGDGSLNTGTVMGIDISKHNGNIDCT